MSPIGNEPCVCLLNKEIHTPLKADHPKGRPQPLVGHLRIQEAFLKIMCCVSIVWSADEGGIATEVCLIVPNYWDEQSTQTSLKRAAIFQAVSQTKILRAEFLRELSVF